MAGKIRQPIDLDKFQKFVEENVPQIKTPFDVKQFGYGQSNPTYLLTSPDGSRYVMRKKPPGKLLSKTAHQVDREYRIIHALQTTDVPVPDAIILCEDDAIIGTPFYIMSYLDGRIFPDPSIPDVTESERKEMWRSAITTLGKFHRINPSSVKMENFGRGRDFYNRQLKTFSKISTAQAETTDVESGDPVGPIPHYDDIVSFFSDPSTQPVDRATFVHGDYKIDNLVFHPTEPHVIGILDWEMATLGHPLSDLGNLLMPFTIASSGKAPLLSDFYSSFAPENTPGLPSKKQCLEWYAETVGWEYPGREVAWGDSFVMYRSAIICQGIAARYARRQASSEKAMIHAQQFKPFGEMAWEAVQEAQRAGRKEVGAKL